MTPCPFCGEKSELSLIRDKDPDLYRDFGYSDWVIHCDNCSAQGPACSTQQEAAKSWNERK